jgi:hypothetical protein
MIHFRGLPNAAANLAAAIGSHADDRWREVAGRDRWAAGRTSYLRTLIYISMLLLMAGCGSVSPSVHRGSSHREVPLDVVIRIPSRLETLQPGMTPTQVLAMLGLADYPLGGDCSGPTERFEYQLFLRLNFSLTLIYDERTRPASFLRARLDGDGWRKVQQ